MAFPKNYKTIHITKDLRQDLDDIKDFGNIGVPEKINQLIRFYRAKKEIK